MDNTASKPDDVNSGGFDDPGFEKRYGPFSKWARAGFTADLLPIIPPGATLSANSKIEPAMLGKIPGRYLGDGIWCGFPGFTQYLATEAEIAEWNSWPGVGVGLLARNHPAVDIDVTDPELAKKVHQLAVEMLGPAPCRTGRAPKRLLLYKGAPMKKRYLVFESGDAIEVLGAGQQFVVGGIHPKTRLPYVWSEMDPLTMLEFEFSEITPEKVSAFLAEAAKLAPVKTRPVDEQRIDPLLSVPVEHSADVEPLKALLKHLDPDVGYHDWWPVIAAIENSPYGTAVEREAIALAWSRGDYHGTEVSVKWKGDADVRKKFRSLQRSCAERDARGEQTLGYGSLVKWTQEAHLGGVDIGADAFDPFRGEVASPAQVDPFAPRQIATQSMFADGDDWPVAYTTRNRQPATPLVELIPGLAEKDIVTFLEGIGGIGKSVVALQDGICVSAGRTIYGRAVIQCDCLYLNYEETKDEMDRRIQKLIEYFDNYDGYRHYYDNTIDLSGFHLWQLKEHPRPLFAVKSDGAIWVTHFGNRLLHWLAQRRDHRLHTFVVFDGIIDAIAFGGNSRNDDGIARQVIAELDRLALQYNFTAYAIIHPSRAGERSGTGSYAPAWSTKPRAIQSFTRVNLSGGSVLESTPRSNIGTRRKVTKRSHGPDGEQLDLRYDRGSFQSAPDGVRGGEDADDVAVEIAIHQAKIGAPICRHDGGRIREIKLTNVHFRIEEYCKRTGKKLGVKHLLDTLKTAEQAGKIVYKAAWSNRPAGYYPTLTS